MLFNALHLSLSLSPFLNRAPLILYVVAVGVCLLAVLLKGKYELVLSAIEERFSQLAGRPILAAVVLFLGVFLLRAAVLPHLPVPTPGVHDEFSYLLLGDTLAHGRLTNPVPPLWKSFETFHELFSPTYCSKYPPAQGAVLAIGQLLGNPWFGVLLSAAAMAAAFYWGLLAWMPARWAFLAAFLAAARLCLTTYWVNSFWGGAPASIGGALTLGGLGRILHRPSRGNALVLGLGISILANSRPYEGAAFCLPVAAVFLWWAAGKMKSRLSWRDRFRKVILPLTAVLLANFAFMGYYNWRLTGHASIMPVSLYEQRYNPAAIFIWQTPLPNVPQDNRQFDQFYNGWMRNFYRPTWEDFKSVSLGKAERIILFFLWWELLLIVPALYFAVKRKKMFVPWAVLLSTAVGFLLLAWVLPHYIAPALVAIFALIVTGMRYLRLFKPSGLELGLFFSRIIVLGLSFQTAGALMAGTEDRFGFGGVRLEERVALIHQLDAIPGKHVVFVYYSPQHNVHDEWVFNGAEIDTSKIIWARELSDEQDRKVAEYYKDRTVWIIEADRPHPRLWRYAPGN